MSKSIKIQRDGVTETYSGVKKIKTDHPTQGTVSWVPYEDTELAIKTVNKNGTYKASSDGYYGYRRVVVNVNGKVVGTRPDGRTYAVDTDEVTGYLTSKLMPDNIKIAIPPFKDAYHEGESINLTGMVVKAYSKTDIWTDEDYPTGEIPLEEVTARPTTASGEGVKQIAVEWSRPEDGAVLSDTFEIVMMGEA